MADAVRISVSSVTAPSRITIAARMGSRITDIPKH